VGEHEAERGLWAAARELLESRLHDAEALAARAGQLEVTAGQVQAAAEAAARALAVEREAAEEARRQLAAAHAEIDAARGRIVELERARDAARHEVARAERAHAEAAAAWDERRRALEEG